MPKRTYTEIVASIEVHQEYTSTHLRNIDAHMAKQNDTIYELMKDNIKNKNNIGWIIKIGGSTVFLGLIASALKIIGVY